MTPSKLHPPLRRHTLGVLPLLATALAGAFGTAGCGPGPGMGAGPGHAPAPGAPEARGRAEPETCLAPEPRTRGQVDAGLAYLDGAPATEPPGSPPGDGLDDLDRACARALLLERIGRLDEARQALQTILAARPERVDALLLLRRVETRDAHADRADALLERAAELAPRDPRVRILEAAGAEGEERARRYEEIAGEHPGSAEAWIAAARARLDRDRPDSARSAVARALALDSLDADAWLVLVRVEEHEGRDSLALAGLRRAVAADSLSAAARVALANRLRADADLEGAFAQQVAALAFDPWNAAIHDNLGNGGSVLSWGRYPPLQDDEVPPELARALDEADGHLGRRELDRAEAGYREILARWPDYASALLGLSAVAYQRGEWEAARKGFGRVARAYPGLGLAHYGVSQSLARLRDRDDPELAEAAARFDARPRPPEPEGLRLVFPDFDRVDADLQKIILLSVAPLSHYVQVLAVGGATFQLIPFHERLWEIPHAERNRGRRTFDLRLWDDVKGQGGFHASAGEAWVREVEQERFNVLAHEFMHQVHSMFTEEQKKEVEALFRRAKAEERTLDSYADYNEMEYLAQAYEAWISPRKAPGLGGTAGHTRGEVEEKDPGVVRFLEGVNARPSYRDNEIIAYRQRMANLTGEGDLVGARRAGEEALARYGEDGELLAGLAGVARLEGAWAEAEALDRRAVAAAPDVIRGWLGLAADLADGGQDPGAAAAALEGYLARDPDADEAWLTLGALRLAAGRYEAAERALGKADSLLGPANPESAFFSLRAELARVRGDTATTRTAYEHTIRTISRSDIPGWTTLAVLALEKGDVDGASADLATARAIDADHPRVREVAALVLDARGRTDEAVDTLLALHREDPRRLETLTELVKLVGRDGPGDARPWIDAGRSLVQHAAPVTYSYERDRWVAHGRLTAPAVARFEAAARALSGGG